MRHLTAPGVDGDLLFFLNPLLAWLPGPDMGLLMMLALYEDDLEFWKVGSTLGSQKPGEIKRILEGSTIDFSFCCSRTTRPSTSG